MSKIIVVEGPDRVGKFTQTHLLQDYLVSIGKKAVVVEVPIKDKFTYELIYWMLRNGSAKTFPKIFQLLQFMNRWIFQKITLPSLEKTNDYVIFDRWSLSTSVYGLAEGLSRKFVDSLYERLVKPDFTFVLLGPAHEHEAEDVYEKDKSLQSKVRNLYSNLSKSLNEKSHIIDCSRSKEDILSEELAVLVACNLIEMKNTNNFSV